MNSSNVPLNNNLPSSSETNMYDIYNMSNFLLLFSFFSPIILAIFIVSLTFIFQNFKGLIYLGFLLGSVFLREFIFSKSDYYEKYQNNNNICTTIKLSNTGNNTFSIFIFTFTFMYLFLPMFFNNSYNWLVFALLLFYIFLDIGVKSYQKCIIWSKNIFQFLLDFLMGIGISSIIVISMYAGGSSKFLFFNEINNDVQICSMPKKQTFKCALYKNGELVKNTQ